MKITSIKLQIIKHKGIYSLIVPNAWVMVYSGKGLGKYILDKQGRLIEEFSMTSEGINFVELLNNL